MSSREVGIFFFHFIFQLTRIYRKYKGGNNFFRKKVKKSEKKVPVGPFKPSRAVGRKQLFIQGWPK